MSTKSIGTAMEYLDQATNQTPGRLVPYDELATQIRGSDGAALSESSLSFALQYLVRRGYAEEVDGGYRLTQDGAAFLYARRIQDGVIRYGSIALAVLLFFFLGSSARCTRQAVDVLPPVVPAVPVTATVEEAGPEAVIIEQTATAPSIPRRQPGSPWFQVGDQVVVVWSADVNIRRTPGYLHKPSGDECDSAKPGQRMQIIGGPIYKDEIYWWETPSAKCGGSGWIAQTRHTGDILLDYP